MISILFNPLIPLLVYLGISVTTLHHEVDFLVSLHFEFFIFCWSLLSLVIYFYKCKYEFLIFLKKCGPVISFCLILIFLPIVSSISNNDYLNILSDGEYRTLAQALILLPALFYFLQQDKYRLKILNAVLVFYVIFGFYFLFRFYILHEARAFDSRPTLKIRHGDPNFLCLFFSMMTPLAMQMLYINLKKKYLAILYGAVSLFFIICALITESRMGLISLILGLVLLFVLIPMSQTKKASTLLTILISLGCLFALKPDLTARFSSINDKSSADRVLTYENGIKTFAQSPLFGVGMHLAKNTYFENSEYPLFQSDTKRLEIHNTYLNILSELGTIGLLTFFVFMLWLFKTINLLEKPNRYFLISSYIIMSLSMFTIGVSYKDLIYYQLVLLAGLASAKDAQSVL